MLQVMYMKKGSRGQQSYFRPEWFMGPNQETIIQEMSTVNTDSITNKSTIIQKGIQAVLVETGLWPQEKIRLECKKPKCTNCQTLTIRQVCIRGRKCDS